MQATQCYFEKKLNMVDTCHIDVNNQSTIIIQQPSMRLDVKRDFHIFTKDSLYSYDPYII